MDGVYEGGAEAGAFEDVEGGDGGAAGGGDVVFELGGVLVGGKDHLGRPEDSLGGEEAGGVAGQALLDAAVGEGFDHQINVGGAGAGQARSRRPASVSGTSTERPTAAKKDWARRRVLLGRVGAPAEGGRAFADEAGRVRHGADDGDVGRQQRLHFRKADAGGDGDERAETSATNGRDLRRERPPTMGGLTASRIRSAPAMAAWAEGAASAPGPKFGGQAFGFCRVRVEQPDAGGGHGAAGDEAASERPAHHARAQHGQCLIAEHTFDLETLLTPVEDGGADAVVAGLSSMSMTTVDGVNR